MADRDDVAYWERTVDGGQLYRPPEGDALGSLTPDPAHYSARAQDKTLTDIRDEIAGSDEWVANIERATERLQKIAGIREADVLSFKREMEEVLAYDNERLENELQRNSLLKGNKDLEAAIAEMKKGAAGNVTDEMKERVSAMQTVLAQQKALNALGEDGKKTAVEMIKATRESTGAKLGIFDIRGQIDEFKETVSHGNITDPSTLMAILKKNPLIAAASLGLSQIPNMESRGMGISVPMLGRFQIPGSDFGNVIREGQVTGEGYGAGIAARWEGFRAGLNPFDIMSREVSAAIVRGVRSRGFSGALGRAFQDAVGDIYQDTGLDPDMLIGMGDQFARRDQLGQFRTLISDMDDLAKETNRSITNIAAGFEEFRKTFETFGGMTSAIPNAAAMNTTLNRFFPGLGDEEKDRIAGWMNQALPLLSGRTPAMAHGPQLNEAVVGMTQNLQGFSTNMQGMNHQQRREYLAMLASQPMFQGLGVDQIEALLRDPQKFLETFQAEQKGQILSQGRGRGRDMINNLLRESGMDRKFRGGPSAWFRKSEDEREEFVSTLEGRFERFGYRGPDAKELLRDFRGVETQDEWDTVLKKARREVPRWAEFRAAQRVERQQVDVTIGFRGRRAAEILEADFKHRKAVRGEDDYTGTRHAGADFG